MLFDRRISFRAALSDTREGKLWVGRRSVSVQIINESAGGLCVVSEGAPQFAVGCEAELETDDGDCMGVCLVYLQELNGTTRIGLRREMASVRGESLGSHARRATSPLMILVGVTLGLYAGFAVKTDSIRSQLAQVPTVAQLVYR